MNIFQKIKALIIIRKAVNNMGNTKAGWKTTEFWLVIATNLITITTAIQGTLSPQTATITLAVLNAFYTVLRTLAKSTTPPTVPPATP